MATENRAGRRTRFEIAGGREAAALAATLGAEMRRGRISAQLTQAALARRVGIRRTRIGELERGEGASAPASLWVSIGQAIARPIAMSFTRPMLVTQPKDAGHLDIQELVLALAGASGITRHFELPTRPANPSLSVDVLLRLDAHRLLLLIEIWNRLEDIGAAARTTKRKAAEAMAVAVVAGGAAGPYGVRTCWVLRDSASNRALVRRYPAIFRTEFPGSSRGWVAALEAGVAPPAEPGILWASAANGLSALNMRRAHGREHSAP